MENVKEFCHVATPHWVELGGQYDLGIDWSVPKQFPYFIGVLLYMIE